MEVGPLQTSGKGWGYLHHTKPRQLASRRAKNSACEKKNKQKKHESTSQSKDDIFVCVLFIDTD